MTSGLINYLCCAALWLGLLLKAPDLARRWHDPFLRVICAVLGLAGLSWFAGAPPTVGAVNRLSGVPNLAAPLTYAVITAYSAASLVLIVHWRGGPDVRRTTRRWTCAYTGVIGSVALMFVLGHAHEKLERRTDFDTYYATTPYAREMIVLYLVGHLVAASATTVLTLRWAREVHGRLRAGMVTFGIGAGFGVGYSVSKLTAVVARWCGLDWSALSTTVSPSSAGLGALLAVVGILIPLAGPQVAAWALARRTYLRLGPLERELDDILVRESLRFRRPPWYSPALRLMWRQSSIHNALGHLDAYLDPALFEQAYDAAVRATGDRDHAEAAAWAAVIAAAAHPDRSPDQPPRPRTTRLPHPIPGPALLVRIADIFNTPQEQATWRPAPGTPAAPGHPTPSPAASTAPHRPRTARRPERTPRA
ncbi:hypothetical protein OK074_5390 [Actinobacteria bacterium OK074]|nr:hypothetical protein OK074_5390 [Actinobacteria bacterium OK074]